MPNHCSSTYRECITDMRTNVQVIVQGLGQTCSPKELVCERMAPSHTGSTQHGDWPELLIILQYTLKLSLKELHFQVNVLYAGTAGKNYLVAAILVLGHKHIEVVPHQEKAVGSLDILPF